jgi:hypothetical protein
METIVHAYTLLKTQKIKTVASLASSSLRTAGHLALSTSKPSVSVKESRLARLLEPRAVVPVS